MPLQDFPQASFGNADGRKKSTAPQSPWRFFLFIIILKSVKGFVDLNRVKEGLRNG